MNLYLRESLEEFSDIFVPVRSQIIKPNDFEKLRPELVDMLFRPACMDFRPYWYDMDLRRSMLDNLVETVIKGMEKADSGSGNTVVIRGEAGVGKTSVLKRLSVDLVKEKFAVFWCRRAQKHRWPERLRAFVDEVNKMTSILSKDCKGIVIISDDPVSLRISNSELANVVSRIDFPTQTVLSVRNSEFSMSDSEFRMDLQHDDPIIELPYTLDQNEVGNLPALVLKIGATQNIQDAEEIVSKRDRNEADDILCSLWYLVPETRKHLENSLGNEYLRLGSQDESIRGLASASDAADTGRVARNAYEIVAVASNLKLGVPMEVLVHAIQVDYMDWVDMLNNGRPLWGLIYPEDSEDGKSFLYRTRNSIVTKVLINLVNGGIGRSGEFRALKRMVEACSSSPTYRNFLVEILIEKRRNLESFLEFEQGKELFQVALDKIDYPDKILEHHYGVWIHHKGDDLQKAYGQLEKALECADHPYSTRTKDSHIKTSQAAVIVQMVKNGEKEPQTGLNLVREHLRGVSQSGASDPYTSHILANMLSDLSENENISPELAGTFLSEALSEIQGALQRVGSGGRARRRQRSIRDVEALRSLRRKIIEDISNQEQILQIANEMFDKTGAQDGFRVYFQILFSNAANTNRGTDYNTAYQYINCVIQRCENSTYDVQPELYSDRADLVVRWQVHGMKSGINWDTLRKDLEVVLSSPYHSEDLLKQFYYAVACYHCGARSEANTSFARIRQKNPDQSASPWMVRCAYLGKEGSPRRLQGRVSGSAGAKFVAIDELEDTVRIPKGRKGRDDIRQVGATIHVYVGFSLRGTTILRFRPESGYFELP